MLVLNDLLSHVVMFCQFRLIQVVPFTATQGAHHFTWLLAVVPWIASESCLLGERIDFNQMHPGNPINRKFNIFS